MDCNQAKDYLIDAVIGGALSADVAAHLADCPDCRKEREELARSWASLGGVRAVRFPRSLARETVRRAAEEERIARYSPRRLVFASPSALWRTGLASLAAAAAAAAIVYFSVSPENGGQVDRMASTFRARSSPLPDPAATLSAFLGGAEEILSSADRGGYQRWGDVFRDIFRSDLEGQGRYLLDTLAADSPARPAVQAASDAFWALLQSGRGREGDAVVVPPEAKIADALREIRTYRAED